MATRPQPPPSHLTCQARKRTLLVFLRPAAGFRVAAHHQHLPALGVDDLRAPVGAQAKPEIDAAPKPFGEGDLAVAVEVAQRGRHLAFPRELDRAQAREEEEGDRKNQDECQKRPIALQDSTR